MISPIDRFIMEGHAITNWGFDPKAVISRPRLDQQHLEFAATAKAVSKNASRRSSTDNDIVEIRHWPHLICLQQKKGSRPLRPIILRNHFLVLAKNLSKALA